MDEMLLEAGVNICYEQTLCAVKTEADGELSRIKSVLITSKSGLVEIEADCYIDCTGDGDLSVFAGAKFELGEPDELGLSLQPGTIRAYLGKGNFTDEEFAKIDKILQDALDCGQLKPADLNQCKSKQLFHARYNNINHISRFNGADSHEKTLANIEGRRCVARLICALKRAGIDVDMESISPETAPRETRRIVCDGTITAEDYVSAKTYPDGICTSFYPIDLHRDGTEGIKQQFLEFGKVPSIPLSAMIVSGISNLFVAGRCISGDRLANSAFRVKASCMAMGQACGAAAVLSVKENHGRSRELDFPKLCTILIENNAIVPKNKTQHNYTTIP